MIYQLFLEQLNMKYLFLSKLLLFILTSCQAQAPLHQNTIQNISKNGMSISWHHQNDRIYIEMSAPTDGWVAIGFNTHAGTTGTYLLMGHIINGKANVVEYYTTSPGDYNPITTHGAQAKIQDIEGVEKGKSSTLKFSLPILATSKYQRNLTEGTAYIMLIAYSREDDFKHHSMMRTSVEVKL